MPPAPQPPGAAVRRPPASVPVVAGLCLVLACSTLLLPAAPSYDPWSWLVWGREVLRLDLQTSTGPSWKPLPVLFTAPFSLFGDAAPSLWLVVARTAQFGAIAVAAVLGHRLGGRVGAVAAGAFIALETEFWTPVLLGNSEGLLLLCVLAAFERHLAGHAAQAFALGVAAALVRAEAWPFLLAYAGWLVLRDHRRLAWILPGLAVLPALWLLPELWGSGSLSRGADRALQPDPSAPAFAQYPALRILRDAARLLPLPVVLGLGCAVVTLGLRRAPRAAIRPVVALAALGVAWLLLVAVMTEFGFSGITRYLLMPLAVAYVVAGVGYGWALGALRAAGGRTSAAALGVALVLAAVLGSAAQAPEWSAMRDFAERHGTVTSDLDAAIARAGGEQRLEGCGTLSASFLMIPPVAWRLDRHLADVSPDPRPPGVILRARLLENAPLEPPRTAFAGVAGRDTLARTRYWDVEAACSPG